MYYTIKLPHIEEESMYGETILLFVNNGVCHCSETFDSTSALMKRSFYY